MKISFDFRTSKQLLLPVTELHVSQPLDRLPTPPQISKKIVTHKLSLSSYWTETLRRNLISFTVWFARQGMIFLTSSMKDSENYFSHLY
jgi:hypothetical protein